MRLLNTLVFLSAFAAINGNAETETDDGLSETDDGQSETSDGLFINMDVPNGDEVEVEGVLVLNINNFYQVVAENEFVLVEFYAPWCSHCKSLAPEYSKAAKELKEKGSTIKLAKVEATEETQLSTDFSIRGYPTLKFFRNGIPIDYSGRNTAEDIVNWVNMKSGLLPLEIGTVEDAEEFIKNEPVVVIGFFDDRESDEARTFLKVVSEGDDCAFGITSNEDVYAKYEAESGSIILFKNFDEGKAIFDDEPSKEEIEKFIASESTPLILDFSRDTLKKLTTVQNHLVMFISKDAGHIEKYATPAADVAKEFKNQVLFVTVNVDEGSHKSLLDFFGVTKEQSPLMRLIRNEDDMNRYMPDEGELSPENIRTFIEDFLANKLKRYLRSQELPEDWDEKPVKTLVSSNFDEVVFNEDKDVLVEFYSPRCGYCQALAPIYDELAEKFKDSETIVIAKIDSTNNELEHTPIKTYPILRLYKKGDNAVVDYKGNRTLASLVRFLESRGEEQDEEEQEEERNEEEEENEVEEEEDTKQPNDEL